MLPKHERLKRADFSHFFNLGTRFHSPLFTLVFYPDNKFHASVVVSKKIATHATDRNTIRRRTYEVIRNYHRRTPLQGIFILITKQPITKTPSSQLKEQLETLIGRTQKVG